MNKILITGTSGFIGFHLVRKLLEEGEEIIGIDNENSYYDITLKQRRRKILTDYDNFKFYKTSLENLENLKEIFQKERPQIVVNLAAQAGVRYSLKNPFAYIQTNLVGFHNIIELSKQYKIKNFIYASSSSVYGKNEKQPFSVEDRVDHPISLYAATKKSNELIAHAYSHLFGLPTTGLRFFTVYGPYGRPDMAMFIFAKKILNGEKIPVFNYGKMKRDFTYIDDIVDGIIKSLNTISDYEVFNLGNDNPVELEYVISLIEKNLGKKAIKDYLPIQPGDVPATWSDINHTKEKLGWKPTTSIEEGIEKFIDWFKKEGYKYELASQ